MAIECSANVVTIHGRAGTVHVNMVKLFGSQEIVYINLEWLDNSDSVAVYSVQNLQLNLRISNFFRQLSMNIYNIFTPE